MKVEMWPVADVKPYDRNPRVNDAAVEAVAASLRDYGWRQPVVVDEQGVIVVGHTRYKAALKLGLTEVHVAAGLTAEQVRAYRIADNQTATLSGWDEGKLIEELAALERAGFDLDLTGFTADELLGLLQPEATPGLTDPDDVPEPPDEPVTRSGDLWILGRHRLLCGDSAKPEDVRRLTEGRPVQLVNTDPPYGVAVEPRSAAAVAAGNSSFPAAGGAKPGRKLKAKDSPLANDSAGPEEYGRLLRAWFGSAASALEPGRAFYVWGGYGNLASYPPALAECGLYLSQCVVWDKQHPVLNRKDFMSAWEMCQPPDTSVLTAAGSSSLAALRDGDRVVSFYAQGSALVGLRDGLGVRVARRPYDGDLYGVAVGPRQSWTTDGHLWTARMSRDFARKWCVYLMRRGAWWRVGVTKMRTTWGFGLKGRLCSERGDEGWILSLHDSHADARVHEQLVSVRFGVPQTCWQMAGVAGQRQRYHVEELYARLDPAGLERAAGAALAAYRRRREHPLVVRADTRAKFGARWSIQVRACNLLTEIMEVPVPAEGQRVQWQPIRAIDVQPYSGVVHSLGVERHEHYVADGLVTHNCYYGWKEGAAHRFFGPNNVTDLWQVKKVSPQKMTHLTEKPVELAARSIEYSSRPGERVLDLFGGSGSTLIACEPAGRTALLMELDPLYCDVIVRRFEEHTGKKAERQAG